MTNEQREAIELAKEFTEIDFSNPMGWTGYYDTELKELSQAIETVLSMLKEKNEQIAKYEKIYKEYDCYRWVKELDKKDRQIDLMANYIVNLIKYNNPEEIREVEELKQYFKRKSEK